VTNAPHVIELQNICTSYDQGRTFIIKDFSMVVEDVPEMGEFIVLLGKSGCGKTTLLKYIAGLMQPYSGEIYIRGKSREQSPPISMVFQEPSTLEHYTVLKNVMLPLLYRGVPESEAAESAMNMIKAVDLEGHENKYAKFGKLSGGQLQRVVIARSLIANPGIILMDEPNRGLDNDTGMQINLLISNLWNQLRSTIVLVTHQIEQAVLLGTKLFIMGGKPASLVRTIDINLPYPRSRETTRTREFLELKNQIDDWMYEL
jgi:NitT/TauT family transport system ATP-binding protein